MLTAISVKDSWELLLVLKTKGNNVFTEFLLGATIWDDGKKEKSNNSIQGFFSNLTL